MYWKMAAAALITLLQSVRAERRANDTGIAALEQTSDPYSLVS